MNYAETKDTLKFGMNAGAIKNFVKVNERAMIEEKISLGKTQLN